MVDNNVLIVGMIVLLVQMDRNRKGCAHLIKNVMLVVKLLVRRSLIKHATELMKPERVRLAEDYIRSVAEFVRNIRIHQVVCLMDM